MTRVTHTSYFNLAYHTRTQMSKLIMPQFLLFGDSLTEFSHSPYQGWACYLADAYRRRVDICNRGFGGYTSRGAKPLIEPILRGNYENSYSKPLLISIWLGTNDCVNPQWAPDYAVPIPEYKDNMMYIMLKVKAAFPKIRILIITPPPVDVMKWGGGSKPIDRTYERTKEYRNACLSIGEEAKKRWPDDVAILNAYTALGISDDISMEEITLRLKPLLSDGVHFSSQGSELIARGVLETIRNNWSDLDPNNMPWPSPELHADEMALKQTDFDTLIVQRTFLTGPRASTIILPLAALISVTLM
ncbi:hypothetical protein HDU67_002650, partial [Dinochytrium kinnereticum]